MTNVTMKVDGNKLIIEVDLTQNHGQTGSGKSIKIAGTDGNVSVPGHEEIKIGLNVYKPLQK